MSEKSRLYQVMKEMGYPEDLCEVVSREMRSEISETRMIGYLYHYSKPSVEQVVDEMLAIQSDRDAWIQKKQMENTQAKWNQFLNEGFPGEE